jgi:hypothetical protein
MWIMSIFDWSVSCRSIEAHDFRNLDFEKRETAFGDINVE